MWLVGWDKLKSRHCSLEKETVIVQRTKEQSESFSYAQTKGMRKREFEFRVKPGENCC